QPEYYFFLTDLCAQIPNRLLDVILHRPVFGTTANVMNEIGDNLFATRGVRNFRMKLKGKEFSGATFNGGVFRVFSNSHGFESGRQFREFITVRIPHLKSFRQVAKERRKAVFYSKHTFSKLAFKTRLYFHTQEVRHDLKAVADTQNRNSKLKNLRVGQRRFSGIDTGR